MTNLKETSSQICLLRIPEVMRRVGYKRTQIYQMIKEGRFPKNIKMGPRAVGWNSKEIDQWIQDQINKRNH